MEKKQSLTVHLPNVNVAVDYCSIPVAFMLILYIYGEKIEWYLILACSASENASKLSSTFWSAPFSTPKRKIYITWKILIVDYNFENSHCLMKFFCIVINNLTLELQMLIDRNTHIYKPRLSYTLMSFLSILYHLTFYYMNIFEIPLPLDYITFLFFSFTRYNHNQILITISSFKYLNFKLFVF